MENNETSGISQLARREGATRWVKRVALATLSASAFVLFAGGITSLFQSTNADTEVQISAAFGNGSLVLQDGPCAASANQPAYDSTNNTLNMSGIAGSIISNCVQITAGTTSPQGYTLMIDGPDTGNLSLANLTLNNKDGSITTPTVFASQTSGGVWGFAIPSGQLKGITAGFDSSYQVLAGDNIVNTAKYAPVPTTATPFSYTDGANALADSYDIYFGAHLGANAPTGNYTGVVTVSIVGNAAAPVAQTGDDIQTVTAANCPAERTRVKDARDGATYWVRKIPGTGAGGTDLCWMETNLAYGGGGTNTYGDVTTAITENNTTSDVTYAVPTRSRPTGANRTTGTTNPSTSTTGTGQYGYLYNWCAAMNGQAAACQSSTATQPNQSVNGGTPTTLYNICPKNWRLPTGEPTTGEFTTLNTAINGGSTTSPYDLFTNGLYMYSGFRANVFGHQGSNGYYWSSTVSNAANAYLIYFDTTSVGPATSILKYHGIAVRCVAP